MRKNLLETQQKNLSALMEILSSIRYLARQRLPFRIHNELNFRQLLLLRAEVDPNFKEWLQKQTNQLFHQPFKMKF